MRGARLQRAAELSELMRGPRKQLLLSIAACLSIATPCSAKGRVNLNWQAAAETTECAAFDGLSQIVEESTAEQANDVLHAAARVDKLGDGTWQLRLSTERDGVSAERVLNAESCPALADAARVVLTVLMAASPAGAETEPPATEPAVTPNAATKVPPLAAPTVDAPRASSTPEDSGTTLRLGVIADLGLHSFGVEGGALFRFGSFGLDAKAVWIPGRKETRPTGWVQMSLLSAGLSGCWLWVPKPWIGVAPCAGLEVGYFTIDGAAVSPFQTGMVSSHDLAPFLAVDAGVSVSIPARSRFGVRLDASAIGPLIQSQFFPADDEVISTNSTISGRFGAAAEVRFW
jgi:hypothetical protein